jgi:hypothetical protein
MNFALMVSNKVEDKLALVTRHPDWTKDDEAREYNRCLDEVVIELEGKAWAGGNIRVGDFILISKTANHSLGTSSLTVILS